MFDEVATASPPRHHTDASRVLQHLQDTVGLQRPWCTGLRMHTGTSSVIYAFDEALDMPPEPAPSPPAPTKRCGVMVWVEGTGAWVVEIDGIAQCEPMNGTDIGKWCAANNVELAYTPRPPDDFAAYLDAVHARKRKGRSGS